MKICAEHPLMTEYSLCGDAFDAPSTENDVEDFKIGEPGETITRERCRLALTLIRYGFVAHHSGEFTVRR